jgi:hypothetical protein
MMYRFFVFFLMIWSLGALLFIVIALSDLLFTRAWPAFFRRLQLAIIWPLALFSQKGRDSLFHVFQKSQEQSK